MEHLFTDVLNENGYTLALVSSPSASALVMIEVADGPPPGGYLEIRVIQPHDASVDERISEEDSGKLHHIDGQPPKRVIVESFERTLRLASGRRQGRQDATRPVPGRPRRNLTIDKIDGWPSSRETDRGTSRRPQ